jgi:hypothetical protein
MNRWSVIRELLLYAIIVLIFSFIVGSMSYLIISYAWFRKDIIGLTIGICFVMAFIVGIYVCARQISSLIKELI